MSHIFELRRRNEPASNASKSSSKKPTGPSVEDVFRLEMILVPTHICFAFWYARPHIAGLTVLTGRG